jgi:hypothetical protein
MFVILLAGANCLNSCRWTANHVCLSSALQAAFMPNNLQSLQLTLHHEQLRQLADIQGAWCEAAVRQVRHTPSYQARQSQVFASTPRRRCSIKTALQPRCIPLRHAAGVQRYTTGVPAAPNPHDMTTLVYPISPHTIVRVDDCNRRGNYGDSCFWSSRERSGLGFSWHAWRRDRLAHGVLAKHVGELLALSCILSFQVRPLRYDVMLQLSEAYVDLTLEKSLDLSLTGSSRARAANTLDGFVKVASAATIRRCVAYVGACVGICLSGIAVLLLCIVHHR